MVDVLRLCMVIINRLWPYVWFGAAKRTLGELRQLYFKMKDKVFGTERLGFAYNTEALEHLLIQEFGTTMRLTDQEFPKYIE